MHKQKATFPRLVYSVLKIENYLRENAVSYHNFRFVRPRYFSFARKLSIKVLEIIRQLRELTINLITQNPFNRISYDSSFRMYDLKITQETRSCN